LPQVEALPQAALEKQSLPIQVTSWLYELLKPLLAILSARLPIPFLLVNVSSRAQGIKE